MMKIELTTTERNALVNILRRHEHSDGARSVLNKIEPGYSIGDRFTNEVEGGEYVLAQVGSRDACIINIDSGRFWCWPTKVEDITSISQSEFELMCQPDSFVPIEKEK